MFLKRFANSLRKQEWGSFAIEFLIVLLGVFLALQAEDWNQERKDRNLEQEYILRLIDETRANIDILEQHEQIFEEKVEFILALSTLSLDDAMQDDPLEFMYQLDYSTYVGVPNLRAETYQELESSGRLTLLRNSELRSAVAGLINDYRLNQVVFTDQIGNYRRLLFQTLPGEAFYKYRVSDEVTDRAPIISAIEDFRNNPGYIAAANAEITYGSDALFYMTEFKKRAEDILMILQP
jgi:hypothetical protein